MEYKQLVEQIDQRHQRLTRLAGQRQEYEQSLARFIRWFDDQHDKICTPLIPPFIPLKIIDLERLLKKSRVSTNSCEELEPIRRYPSDLVRRRHISSTRQSSFETERKERKRGVVTLSE